MLTMEEARLIEVQHRLNMAYASLSIEIAERVIIGALLTDYDDGRKGWNTSSLAHYVCLPRTSVRRVMQSFCHMGLTEKRGLGCGLTDKGYTVFLQILRETNKIVRGRQQGYSETLLQLLYRIPAAPTGKRYIVQDSARDVSFPPLQVPDPLEMAKLATLNVENSKYEMA